MEPAALGTIATPQAHRSQEVTNDGQSSPTKPRVYQYQIRSSSENMQSYQMGDRKKGEYVLRRGRPDAQADVVEGCSGTPRTNPERVSTGSTGSSENGELKNVLSRRRQVVDKKGSHWESPSLTRSPRNVGTDAVVAKTLFLDSSNMTPEKYCGDKENEPEPELRTTPTKEIEAETSTTPTRRRRTSRQKLLEAAASRLQHLSDEQLTSLTVFMGGNKAEEVSNCSSSERSSEDSPPGRAKSAPAGNRTEFYESAPQYPELRKKRLSGQRATTPMKVRFEGEEEEANGSDDDIPWAKSCSSIGLKAARRLSRGPTGEIVPVSHDDSPQKAEENQSGTEHDTEFTLEDAASVAVGGVTGAVSGGATGFAVGLAGALFTFGLSIPVCTVAGATYQGYKGIVSNLNRGRDATSESSHVRTSSEPPLSAKR